MSASNQGNVSDGEKVEKQRRLFLFSSVFALAAFIGFLGTIFGLNFLNLCVLVVLAVTCYVATLGYITLTLGKKFL